MIVKRADQILNELTEEWRRYVYGWHVFVSNRRSSLDIYRETTLWKLKFVNPLVGWGVRLDSEKEIYEYLQAAKTSYGLRKVSDYVRDRVMKELVELGYLTEKTSKMIGVYEPLNEDDVVGEVAEGPWHEMEGPIAPANPTEKEADDILNRRVAEFIKRNYRMYS